MHVLFVHPNFPGQFGQIAHHLATRLGWPVTFVTSVDTTDLDLPFTHINYSVSGRPPPRAFYNPDNLDELLAHLAAVYRGLRTVPEVRPDLVVGHMSSGTMLYLRNLYPCPFVGDYDLLPPPFWSDGRVLRPELPAAAERRLFTAPCHALTYLHLFAVDQCCTPTHFQRQTAPAEVREKIRVIFDGVDTEFFRRRPIPRPTSFRGLSLGPDTRVVTFVSRGLES